MSKRMTPKTRGTRTKAHKRRKREATPTSVELRDAFNAMGGNMAAVARSFDVHPRTVGRWFEQHGLIAMPVEVGPVEPETHGDDGGHPMVPHATLHHAAGGPPPNGTHPARAASAADESALDEPELPNEHLDGTLEVETQRASEPADEAGTTCSDRTVPSGNATDCNPRV